MWWSARGVPAQAALDHNDLLLVLLQHLLAEALDTLTWPSQRFRPVPWKPELFVGTASLSCKG